MNETTNQMSLLDAIGFSAPEEKKKQKNNKPAKSEASEKKQRKAKPAKAKSKAVNGDRAEDQPPSAEAAASAPADMRETIVAEEGPAPDGAPDVAPDVAPAPDQTAPGEAGTLPLDQYLCFALYSANHAMHGVYKSLLKEVGLTYPQFLAMTVLWENNNVPVGTITSKLQLDTNTLTPLLKRLEAMGLVTRTRNPKDERQVILKLTRKGRSLQKKTEHFSSCILSSTGLKMEDVMELQAKVMQLRDNLRQADADL